MDAPGFVAVQFSLKSASFHFRYYAHDEKRHKDESFNWQAELPLTGEDERRGKTMQ